MLSFQQIEYCRAAKVPQIIEYIPNTIYPRFLIDPILLTETSKIWTRSFTIDRVDVRGSSHLIAQTLGIFRLPAQAGSDCPGDSRGPRRRRHHADRRR